MPEPAAEGGDAPPTAPEPAAEPAAADAATDAAPPPDAADDAARPPSARLGKKRKVALFLGYVGAGYYVSGLLDPAPRASLFFLPSPAARSPVAPPSSSSFP